MKKCFSFLVLLFIFLLSSFLLSSCANNVSNSKENITEHLSWNTISGDSLTGANEEEVDEVLKMIDNLLE